MLPNTGKQQQLEEEQQNTYVKADHDLHPSIGRSVQPPTEKPGERRLAEMKKLYGVGASKIQAMETTMQLSFDRNCDKKQPNCMIKTSVVTMYSVLQSCEIHANYVHTGQLGDTISLLERMNTSEALNIKTKMEKDQREKANFFNNIMCGLSSKFQGLQSSQQSEIQHAQEEQSTKPTVDTASPRRGIGRGMSPHIPRKVTPEVPSKCGSKSATKTSSSHTSHRTRSTKSGSNYSSAFCRSQRVAMEMKILEAKADAAAAAKQVDFLKRKEEIIEEQAHLRAQEAARQAQLKAQEAASSGHKVKSPGSRLVRHS
uniref:Uncharacterized protein n=1 Tax=Sphaerodactylus townsendi TaxID=933632 RepID=A0ACB8FIP7_9SAUR